MAENGGSSGGLGFWHFACLAVVVGGVIGLVYLVMNQYTKASDVATILGIVVPALATIGAAGFGVKVAYERGANQGKARGKKEAANAVEGHVQEARDAWERTDPHQVRASIASLEGALTGLKA